MHCTLVNAAPSILVLNYKSPRACVVLVLLITNFPMISLHMQLATNCLCILTFKLLATTTCACPVPQLLLQHVTPIISMSCLPLFIQNDILLFKTQDYSRILTCLEFSNDIEIELVIVLR